MLFNGANISKAVKEPRVHDTLLSNVTWIENAQYEGYVSKLPASVVQVLTDKGHVLEEDAEKATGTVCGV